MDVMDVIDVTDKTEETEKTKKNEQNKHNKQNLSQNNEKTETSKCCKDNKTCNDCKPSETKASTCERTSSLKPKRKSIIQKIKGWFKNKSNSNKGDKTSVNNKYLLNN